MGQGLSTNYLGDPNQPEDDLDRQFGSFLDNGMMPQAQNQFLPKSPTNQNQKQQDLIRMFSEDSPSQPPQIAQPQRPQVIPPQNPQPQSFIPPNIGNLTQPIQPPAMPQAGQPQMQPMGVPQPMMDSPQQQMGQMGQMQQPQGMDLASGAVRPNISDGASPHQMSAVPPEEFNPNEQAEEEQIKQTTQQILTNPQASLLAEHAAFSPAPANQQVSFDSPEVIAGAVKNEPDVSTAKFDKLTKAQAASTPAVALVENTLQQAVIRPNTNSDPNSPCFADNGAYTCPLTREPCGKKGFFARFFASLRLLLGIDTPENTVAQIQKQRQQDPETMNYFRSQQMQQGSGIPLQDPSANPGMSTMNSFIPPTTGHSQQGM